MKLTRSRWIAAVSALVALGSLEAARRPHYGGELRVETRATNDDAIDPLVFETLVRIDDRGIAQPWLATSWTHDAARKAWIFTPRANVLLHNSEVWSPPEISVADDKPIAEILRELARPRNAIRVGQVGTGPFKISRWDAGKSATLAAHDGYWGM
jgi:ABC-type transport system substrate-binding protein